MGQGTAMLFVFSLFIGMIAVTAGYLYFSSLPPEDKTVFCNEDDFELSFVINDKKKTITMAGEPVKPSHLKIFNESAIEISWRSKTGRYTQMFMDRIAGKLEVQTKNRPADDWNRVKLNCQNRLARF